MNLESAKVKSSDHQWSTINSQKLSKSPVLLCDSVVTGDHLHSQWFQ